MERSGCVAAGILAVLCTGCGMMRNQHKTSLYQSEIDRLSAERSILDRELREERLRRESAEAIVMADREITPAVKILAPETESRTQEKAQKATKGKPTVEEVQKALVKAGYYNGTVDGKYGRKTKDAVIRFQKDAKLQADGKVGPKTWRKLLAYSD